MLAAADIIDRIFVESMQNKPGAVGIIGNEVVANARPDSDTLGTMTVGQTANISKQ